MRIAALTMLVWLVRRVRPVGLAFAVYETWRRLPPEHRRRILLAARQNAPRVASALTRRRRPLP
jgi:hypothetical protein